MEDMAIENRDVSWKVIDVEIHGTVTMPVDGHSHPGVVFVAGSGPTDRNWCSPLLPGSNGSAELLAEELARNGYATIRYDKMASGPHVKENLTKFSGKVSMQTHVDELAGAVETLISQKNVAKDRIYALTNSEGAIHAVNYQLGKNDAPFRGFILSGAPGRSVGEVGRDQLVYQLNSVPGASEIMRHYDEAISAFMDGKPMVPDDFLPDGLKKLLMALETPANLPFSRELWGYSLSEHIGKIKEPVLVIIGRKDLQVSWNTDGKSLEQALSGNRDANFVYPENANHVLKYEGLPVDKLTAEHAASSYNSSDTELDKETVNTVLLWLGQH